METSTLSITLQNAVDGQIESIWPVLAALAAVGILAFAILEMFKIFGLRRGVNFLMLRAWMSRNLNDDKAARKTDEHKNQLASSMDTMVELAFGGDKFLLCSLPADQLAGQINTAVQMALSSPTKKKHLLLLRSLSPYFMHELIEDIENGTRNFDDYRTEITNNVQRNLDVLQVWIDRWWMNGNHLAAIVISTLLIFSFIKDDPGLSLLQKDTYYWLFVSILGGMVAPVAKDLLATLKTVKDRPR